MILNKKINIAIDKINFSHTKEISSYSEADSFIDMIQGLAINTGEDGDEENVVGRVVAYHVNIDDIIREECSIHDVLDEHSHSLSEFTPFFKRDDTIEDIIYETLNTKSSDTNLSDCDEVLFFDNLTVEKSYRGQNIGKILIEATCIDYRRKSRFAFLKAFPLQYEGMDNFNEFSEERKKEIEEARIEFKNIDFKTSQDKLIKLYKGCGFELIKGSENFMVCDLHSRFDW